MIINKALLQSILPEMSAEFSEKMSQMIHSLAKEELSNQTDEDLTKKTDNRDG